VTRRPAATLAAMSFAVAFLASGCSHAKTGLDVQMVNYRYKPVHVSITGGESVTFHNGTQITHNFTLLKGGSVAFDVQPGSSMNTTDLGTLKPGTYPFECKYHFKQGMIGVLTVSAGGSP
jgi:plastocyanin